MGQSATGMVNSNGRKKDDFFSRWIEDRTKRMSRIVNSVNDLKGVA